MIKPDPSKFSTIHRLADSAIIFSAIWASVQGFDAELADKHFLAAAIAVITFFFFGEFNALYGSWRGVPVRKEIHRCTTVWGLVVLSILLVGFVTGTTESFERPVILSWFLATPVLLGIWRIIFRGVLGQMRRKGHNARTVAIACAQQTGKKLAETILRMPQSGMEIVGFFDDRLPQGERPLANKPVEVVGTFKDLVERAQRGEIDRVYITLPMSATERIKSLIDELGDSTASVYIVPDFFTFNLLHSRWINLGGLATISIFELPYNETDWYIKWAIDFLLTLCFLVVAAIPMAIIALLVKLTSPGPVFFKQRRYGYDGKAIEVWKFRTMTVLEDGAKVTQARKGDARVTPLGAYLRKWSLDELPQFFNVLLGDMSIVGPRPHAIAHNEEYRKQIQGYMLRHKVKPGITGWAQVHGWRGETDTLDKMQKRIEYDLDYIRQWSIGLDLKIMVMTVAHVLGHKNAY